jgi:hypothetical protein
MLAATAPVRRFALSAWRRAASHGLGARAYAAIHLRQFRSARYVDYTNLKLGPPDTFPTRCFQEVPGGVMITHMLTAAITALLDRLIQLKKEGDSHTRNLFKEFVEPIWIDFTRVHETYLANFREYHELLNSSELEPSDSHPVFAAIRRDAAFTLADRKYLIQITNNSGVQPTPREIRDHERVQTFLGEVYRYLRTPLDVADTLRSGAKTRLTDAYLSGEGAGTSIVYKRDIADQRRERPGEQPAADSPRRIERSIRWLAISGVGENLCNSIRADADITVRDIFANLNVDADGKRERAREILEEFALEVQNRFLSARRTYNAARVVDLR